MLLQVVGSRTAPVSSAGQAMINCLFVGSKFASLVFHSGSRSSGRVDQGSGYRQLSWDVIFNYLTIKISTKMKKKTITTMMMLLVFGLAKAQFQPDGSFHAGSYFKLTPSGRVNGNLIFSKPTDQNSAIIRGSTLG